MGGGPGTPDPGRITYTGVPLMFILTKAYDVKNFQINGPSWLDSERFDITAKVPATAAAQPRAPRRQPDTAKPTTTQAAKGSRTAWSAKAVRS